MHKYLRSTVWRFGRFMLFASLLVLPIAAQVLGSEVPSSADVDRAIALATGYLERACGPNGKFAYLLNVSSGEQIDSYNVVRHAGAIYSLSLLEQSTHDQIAIDAMVRAASFLQQNYIGPAAHPGELAVWSKPLPASSSAKLGATGLALVALSAVDQVKPGSIPIQQLQALGRFVLFMQRSDGSFVSKFRTESGPDDGFESLYYPGEAALGLLDLYEVDHSPVWLKAASRALSFLAMRRAGLAEVPLDHWALIATAKLLPYYAQSASQVSREELIRHAERICQSLMRDQLQDSSNPALDGSFDPAGRTAPVATRMEGLLAALVFLPDGTLRTQVKETVNRGITFLLRAQLRDGIHSGGMPGAIIAGALGDTDIRIDFVQHSLCAWLRYKEMYQTTRAEAEPILGRHPGHIRILFGGDTDFGESYQEEYARRGQGNILAEKGYDYSLANLSPLLQSVDYRVLNLETPLTLRHDGSMHDKKYVHYSDPVKAPTALGRFGPIAYSLANNHTLDQGVAGLNDTFVALTASGAHYFGAGTNLTQANKPLLQTFRIGDTSFAIAIFGGLEYNDKYEKEYHFYASAHHPGVATVDVPAVEKAIRELRRQTPSIFVIYYMHTLQNYSWKTSFQVATAKALRHAGVDLVIGSGAHMMQEVEYDDSQWIFYGLGNFVFNARGRYSARDAQPYSLPLVVDVSVEDGKPFAGLRLYPILSDNEISHYQPRFVTEQELGMVRSLLTQEEHWDAPTRMAVKQGKDRTGRYLDFTKVNHLRGPQ